jgi:hypothetical protein
MKSYQEVAVALEAQIRQDASNISIKADGMITGIQLLIKTYNEQVDAETKLDVIQDQ